MLGTHLIKDVVERGTRLIEEVDDMFQSFSNCSWVTDLQLVCTMVLSRRTTICQRFIKLMKFQLYFKGVEAKIRQDIDIFGYL